jgi:hypothetical protein
MAMVNQIMGLVPKADRMAKAAMPVMEPVMSMAYAFSGGMLLSSGPSGNASDARTMTTRGHHHRQDEEVDVCFAALGQAEEDLVAALDLHVELEVENDPGDRRQRQGERPKCVGSSRAGPG